MKKLLILLPLLLAGAAARAQTEPRGVLVVSAAHPEGVSAELNKYEIRRCLKIGAITHAQAREIRGRKRRVARQLAAYQKREAAKLRPVPKATNL